LDLIIPYYKLAHISEENISTKEIFSIGTSVFYQGDDINREGYGKITSHCDDYLGELQFEVTLDDGRILSDITPADFEGKEVAGQLGAPEFQMLDGWEQEVAGWGDADIEAYEQENSVVMNLAY
jgi:hypothetical protein